MNFNLEQQIPIESEVDVLVIGGGTAGAVAAISASRSGSKTMLIEKNGKLGGTTTGSGVNFPGLFHAWGKQIISGPGWEAVNRALEFDNLELPKIVKKPEQHWQQQIRINVFTYTTILDQMCAEDEVDVRMHTMLSYAQEVEDGVIAVLTSKEGLWAVKTKVLIDCTGDANATHLLGYERMRSESLQPGTLMNRFSGYDMSKVDQEDFNERVKQAIEDGILLKTDSQGRDLYGQVKKGKVSMHVTDIDASTSEGKTHAEIEARAILFRIVGFLKTIPHLENLQVTYFAQECGIRETYRVVGEKLITVDDYLAGTYYDDAVCYAFYPVDLHVPGGLKQAFIEEDVFPTIPYGALVPKGSKRLLVAGRCISGDTDSNSATRVQATSMATGQAAGVAASLAAQNNVNVHDINIDSLRSNLEALGAIVPK